MIGRPQEYTFGDLLPSRTWVPCLQHMSLREGGTSYANQNTGYLALRPRTVDSVGQLTVGLKSVLGHFAQKSHHLPLTYFLIHKEEMVTVISSGIYFLDHNPCTDFCTAPPRMGKSASHTSISISNSLSSMSSPAWHMGLGTICQGPGGVILRTARTPGRWVAGNCFFPLRLSASIPPSPRAFLQG